jgi:fumarate hydratase class II
MRRVHSNDGAIALGGATGNFELKACKPHIGYARAAEVTQFAHRKDCALKEAALDLGNAEAADLDRWLQPGRMLSPGSGE